MLSEGKKLYKIFKLQIRLQCKFCNRNMKLMWFILKFVKDKILVINYEGCMAVIEK